MKRISKCSPLAILAASLLALWIFFSLAGSVQAQSKDIQLTEITAKKYEYSNSPIHVKIGTKVLLKITVTDHDHGFTIGTVPDGIKRSGRINSDL